MEEEIRYNHWKTGEEIVEPLEREGVIRTETHVFCPFDHTPILHCIGDKWTSYECPNCQTIYSLPKKYNQKHVDQEARKLAENMRNTISAIDSRKSDLLKLLENATENQLFSKPHKEGEGPTSGTAD